MFISTHLAPESVLTCGLQGGERVETQGEYHQGRVESAPEQKVEAAVCAGVCRSCCCGQAYGGALWSRSSAGPSIVRATGAIHCVPSKAPDLPRSAGLLGSCPSWTTTRRFLPCRSCRQWTGCRGEHLRRAALRRRRRRGNRARDLRLAQRRCGARFRSTENRYKASLSSRAPRTLTDLCTARPT